MVKTTDISPPPLPPVKAFNCISCGSTLRIRAEGLTQVVACSSCGTVIDVSTEVNAVLGKSKSPRTRRMVIPLGTRGKLHGTTWEVIGYVERSDTGSYRWSEYLLFNPMKGFRWLSENNGHWSYVLMTKERPKVEGSWATDVLYSGRYYKLFHKGLAEIIFIEGEFYWRAKVGDRVAVMDFIRENEMLSMEKSHEETVWAVSEYILADDVAKAFKIKEMPPQFGVAPNQPCSVTEKLKSINDVVAFLIIAAMTLQFFNLATSKNQLVHREQFTFDMLNFQSGTKSTQPFVLDDQTANVQIRLGADVENSWLYVQGELVNLDTGESEEFDTGVEYYHGYDEGHWSEGSRISRKNIPSIPGGNYQLNFEVQGDKSGVPYDLTIYRDVPLWRPFIYTMCLIALWPIILWFRQRNFNVQKWADSDYSPYRTAEDE